MVARTTIRTKLYEALADQLTDIVVNSVSVISGVDILRLLERRRLGQILTASIFELAMFYLFVRVLCIRKPEEAIDLFIKLFYPDMQCLFGIREK
uniref:Uncharacterized protein n=1 Tax=Salix viminalis TaxID=40686 RepID=A0A6N2NI21_SALVM